MPRNGGRVGKSNFPTKDLATGIWSLSDNLIYEKENLWPGGDPIIETSGLIFYVDAGNPESYSGSGTTWFDISGNGNNFSKYSSPTFVSAGSTSYFTDFGSGSWRGSSAVLPTGGSARTIISIIRTPSTFAGYNHVFHYGSQSTGQSFGIACQSGGTLETHTWASKYDSGFAMSTNTIYFAATGVTNASTQHGWLNSSSATGGGTASVNTGTAFASQIGSRIDTGVTETWGNGRVYLMAAYNRKLSDQEILSIYAYHKARFGYA
jgi:hypothetical protein